VVAQTGSPETPRRLRSSDQVNRGLKTTVTLRKRLFDQNYLPPISVEAGHFRTTSMSLPAHMFVLSSWELSRNTSRSLAAYGAERPDGAGADHTIMPKSAKRSRLSPMSALDKVNAKMGRGALKPLGAGI